MNRTQQKCFMAATGMHLLLLVILFVGPAFLSSSEKSDSRPLIDFVALKTIEEALAGGGSPNARPSTPAPPAPKVETPQPAPPAPRVEKVEPRKVETLERDTFDPKPVRKLPNINLKPVTRPKNPAAKAKPPTNPISDADAADEQQTRLAGAARNVAKNLQGTLSTGTTVEMPGPGGGGVPYANFLDALKKIYTDAWIVPDGVADDDATATASVTIAKNGDVVSARVTRASGNREIDRSVQMTLDRVRHAVPLPDSAKESERTVTIKFNARVKKGLG